MYLLLTNIVECMSGFDAYQVLHVYYGDSYFGSLGGLRDTIRYGKMLTRVGVFQRQTILKSVSAVYFK